MRFRCKVCHFRVNIYPSYSPDNRLIRFSCPRCLASGTFRNRDYVPFLFVRVIRLASRQYVGVLSSSQLRLGGARLGLKPPINVLDSAEHRYKPKPKYS
jgi:hypothetical protein